MRPVKVWWVVSLKEAGEMNVKPLADLPISYLRNKSYSLLLAFNTRDSVFCLEKPHGSCSECAESLSVEVTSPPSPPLAPLSLVFLKWDLFQR
jgi:hypothetical protein